MCDCTGRHSLRDSEGRFRRHGSPRVTARTHMRRAYLTYLDAQYLAAEAATRGHLLNADGLNRGVRADAWFSLRPPATTRYASPELCDWLEVNRVLSLAEFMAYALEDVA